MKNHMQQGFTLIELLVAVAIVGILAAAAVPSYKDYVKRAEVAEGLNLLAPAKVAVATYYSINSKFPVSNAEAGLPAVDDTKTLGQQVKKIEVVANGVIQVTYKPSLDTINAQAKAFVLNLAPDAAGGSIKWACSAPNDAANGLPSDWLPKSCTKAT